MQYMNIEQNINFYKWKALISFMEERKRNKEHVGGKKEKKKKIVRLQPPRLEISPFTVSQLSNTVYQRIGANLTHRSAKRACV